MRRRFSVQRFDNGLTVVFEIMPKAISTALGFFVKAGARDEDPAQDGISHFLEHMIFKGTQTRNCQELNRAFDALGAHYNAFTGWEETCFYAWVLNEDAPRALELLGGMLSPSLPADEFANEKKVVLDEIARNRDLPDHLAFEEAMRIAFAGHRLSSNVLGTEETVGSLTVEHLQAYLKARYVPGNTVLFACGNVDETVLLKGAEKLWGGGGGPRSERVLPAPVFHFGKAALEKKGLERDHLVLMWPAAPFESRASMAASLLGAVLGDDQNSRLYWALQHTGLAEEAAAGYWGFSDAGVMAAHAACDPAKSRKVIEVLRREAAGLKDGIREEELQRVKNRARTSLVFSAETPFDRFRQLMHQWAVRRELLTAEELLARVEQVTLKDLKDLLKQYSLDGDSVRVALGPPKAVVGQPEPEAKSKAEPKPQPKVESKAKPKAAPKPKAVPKLKPKAAPKPKAASKLKPKPKTKPAPAKAKKKKK